MTNYESFEREFGYLPLNIIEPPFHVRRAFDIFIPAEKSVVEFVRADETDLQQLAAKTVDSKFTGCMKFSNNRLLSRGAALFFQGRLVGAVHNAKADSTAKPTEDSFIAICRDYKNESTCVMRYPLKEEIVLSFAALFLGFPVERYDDYSSDQYRRYIQDWFRENGGTGTLAFSHGIRHLLSFISRGEFIGTFDVDDVKFDQSERDLIKFLDSYPSASCEVSILPPELLSDHVKFGFEFKGFL